MFLFTHVPGAADIFSLDIVDYDIPVHDTNTIAVTGNRII